MCTDRQQGHSNFICLSHEFNEYTIRLRSTIRKRHISSLLSSDSVELPMGCMDFVVASITRFRLPISSWVGLCSGNCQT
jgi:hypothetical protein